MYFRTISQINNYVRVLALYVEFTNINLKFKIFSNYLEILFYPKHRIAVSHFIQKYKQNIDIYIPR